MAYIYTYVYAYIYVHVLMSIYADSMFISFSGLPRFPYRTQPWAQLPSQDLKYNKLWGCFKESQQNDNQTQRMKSGPLDHGDMSLSSRDSRLTCIEAAAVPGLWSVRVFSKTAIVVDSWECCRDRAQRDRTLAGGKVVFLCVMSKLASEY